MPDGTSRFPKPKVEFQDSRGVGVASIRDGKTALKGNVGRYPGAVGIGQQLLGENANPALRLATTVTRSWNDRGGLGIDGDYVPQCNLVSLEVNGECGRVSDLSFGKPIPSTNLDPRIMTGWGTRPYQWEFSGAVQQQLAARVSMNVGYFRRVYGNFIVTDNLMTGRATSAPSVSPRHWMRAAGWRRLPDPGG